MPSAPTPFESSLTLQPVWPIAGQVCTLTRHQTLRLGNLRHESVQHWRVRKICRRALPAGGFAFELTTLTHRQSPVAPGPASLTAGLAPLLATLEVETDATGQLVRVTNQAQLRAHWQELLPALRTRYQHDPAVPPAQLAALGAVLEGADLVALLATWPEYQLLFPLLYGQRLTTASSELGTAVLSQFIGDIDLPLRTEARLAAPPAGAAALVEVAGEVDLVHYQATEVSECLRALLGEPRLDARVVALHQEAYTFGPRQELVVARRHTRADIQGLLSQQLTVLLETQPDLTPAEVESVSLTAARYE